MLSVEKVIELLKAQGALTVDMAEAFKRDTPVILYADYDAVYIERTGGYRMFWASAEDAAKKALSGFSKPARECVIHGKSAYQAYKSLYKVSNDEGFCLQYCYRGDILPVSDICEIMQMQESDIPFIQEHYHLSNDTNYLKNRISAGELWGAYIDGKCAGFIGGHMDGSIGMLEVLPEYRRMGIGTALENHQMNRHIKKGYVPYGQVFLDNKESHALQKKTGLEVSNDVICWCAGEED